MNFYSKHTLIYCNNNNNINKKRNLNSNKTTISNRKRSQIKTHMDNNMQSVKYFSLCRCYN